MSEMRIPVAEPWIGDDEIEAVTQAVRSGWIARGEEVVRFERRFADYLGVREAIAVSSGTAALEVALRALNPRGEEVVTSVSSCVATANAILHASYRPLFVDIDPSLYNMEPSQLEQHLSPKAGAIVPVHLYGHPCDMEPIMALSKQSGVPVIEDCGQSLGAKYGGRPTGTFGRAGCFSLYANKIITTAEGGMIVTSDAELAERARIIRDQGQHPDKPFHHILFGYNFRMSNLHAALGVGQMNRLERIIELRRANAAYLIDRLGDIEGIQLPLQAPWAEHVFFCFPIVLKERRYHRDSVCQFLKEQGIETRPMFIPIPAQPYFVALYGSCKEEFPIARTIGERGFYVSCSPTLQRDDLEYLVATLRESLRL